MTTVTLPDNCRLADEDEAGWYFQATPQISLWITDAPPAAASAISDMTTPEAPSVFVSSDAAGGDDPRAIVYNDHTHRFRAYWDDHIVGDCDCYHEAELALDDYELSLLQDGLLDYVPVSIYARPAELAEFIPAVIADPSGLHDCPCRAALATDGPDAAAGHDALVGAMSAPDTDEARRAAQAYITGEALCYEFRTSPAAFLDQLGAFSDRAREAVNRAVAAYLGCEVGDVVELWGESRVKLVEMGLI
jgi:hypothetical protein